MRIATSRWVLAAALAGVICAAPPAGAQKPGRADVALEAAAKKEMVDGDLKGAIEKYQNIVAEFGNTDRAAVAKALVRMGQCYEQLGSAEARSAYERAVRDFSDQKEAVSIAQARLVALSGARSGPAYRQVWAGPKVDVLGGISPDGRYLSYVDWDTGDLALHDFTTGGDRRLTNKGTWFQSSEFAEESTISKDGKQVAYSWFNGKGRYELRVASLPASGLVQPRRLLDSEDVIWIGPYDWSPDGKWLAVSLQRKDRTIDIGLVSVQTGSLRVLKAGADPRKTYFSPDGRYLGFDDTTPGRRVRDRDVRVCAIDGSGEATVAMSPGPDYIMGWSPDGRLLLFASDRTGTMALWSVPMAAGKPAGPPTLLRPEVAPYSIGVSASGALYVGASISERDIHVASLDFSTGKMLSQPVRPIETFLGSNAQPDWSPDGKFLAYTSVHAPVGGDKVLVILSLDTGQSREVRPNLRNFNWPRWAPDGQSVVSQGTDTDGRQGIYRIDLQTGEATFLATGPTGVSLQKPQWSPDAKRIYYASGGGVFERELASAGVREVLRQKGLIGTSFAVSPDGRYIAARVTLESGQPAVVVAPTVGGEPRELIRAEQPDSLGGYLAWAPGSRGVLVPRFFDSGKRRELWLIPLEGGEPRKLDLPIDQNTNPIRVHPDGRQVAYVAGEAKAEVLVLENFLPASKGAVK